MKSTRLLSFLLALTLVLNACNSKGKSEGEQATAQETATAAESESAATVSETSLSTASAEPGIRFAEATWKAHLAKAKAENKIIFLDAYTTWCGPCKMLQKNVFTQKSVGDFFNQEFINVKMDMESGEGPGLALQYPLEGYPTLLFIDGDGKVVKKVLGYQTPEELLAVGKSIKGAKI
ncbi:hypothetical protein GCM10027299_26530 [Larkinella ripae]